MAVAPKKKKKNDRNALIINGIIILVFLAGIGFVVHLLLSDTGPRRKEKIQVVKLLKPPPPPEEKLPEPEIPKEVPKQEIIENIPQDMPNNNQPQDNTPAGQDLGVDAAGGAGTDGFGLVGRKGGRSLIGGGGSRMSLLAKYGWYTKKVERELWQGVKAILDKNGGIPKGRLELTIHLVLNASGSVVQSKVIVSSGNDRVDQAVRTAMPKLRISEPLPDGMPGGMTIKVSSQG